MECTETGTPPSERTTERAFRQQRNQWPPKMRLRYSTTGWMCRWLRHRWFQGCESRRTKTDLVFCHSTLEGIRSCCAHWQAWVATNPEHLLAQRQMFALEFTARAAIITPGVFTRDRTTALAEAWDAAKDILARAVCWKHSTARRILDYAVADAMGYTRESMDDAAQQVADAAALIRTLDGDPPPRGCEIPGVCGSPAAADQAEGG